MQTAKTIALVTKDDINYELKFDGVGRISCYKYQLDYFNRLEIFVTDENKLGLWFYMDDKLILMDDVKLNKKIIIRQQLINDVPINTYYWGFCK